MADVLSDHVLFEVESIDRLYCNLYVPQLQRAEGIVGFIHGHLGKPIASTAMIAPMSRDFNGHHYAQAQARKAGIGFTALDNGFASCDDVPALQAICDSLTENKIDALARKWLAILPSPYSPSDQAAGYRYDVSVLQAEFSLTQVLDRPLSGRVFFDQVIHDNLAIGRPDQVGPIFGRRIIRKGKRATPRRFRTRVITADVTPSLHVDCKHSKIKQYFNYLQP
ncbi:MAG: hypothetical protein ACRDOA_22200 [Streptosporangiaceae bacterium]